MICFIKISRQNWFFGGIHSSVMRVRSDTLGNPIFQNGLQNYSRVRNKHTGMLIIFWRFFPGATFLLKGATFIDFWILKNFLRNFNFLFLLLCIKESNDLLFRGGYVYSRGYAYCFCQMFQGLCLFKRVRLFRTLE